MSAARHLRVAPSELLAGEIHEVCAQIDRRLGNPPGLAEHAVWFWFGPPGPHLSDDVLTALHADAVEFLHALTTKEKKK